jgi:hypothetical protein
MPALVAGIHVFGSKKKQIVDGRNKFGHDEPTAPALTVHLISLLSGRGFPVLPKLFPASFHREFRKKSPMVAASSYDRVAEWGLILRFSLLISLLAGNCDAETGSTGTASATTYSATNGDFLALYVLSRFSGHLRMRFVSVEQKAGLAILSGAFVSARKIPFPGNGVASPH